MLGKLLAELDATDFRDHDSWFKVLVASHASTGGSVEALKVFSAWSTSDPTYAEAGPQIAQRWKSLDPNEAKGITLGTLLWIVKDSGGADTVRQVQSAIEFSKLEVAEVTGPESTSIFDQHGQTDSANADRFIDQNNQLFRYCPEWNCWLVWDGRRWVIDIRRTKTLGRACRLAKDLWKLLYKVNSDSKRSDKEFARATAFVKSSNDKRRLEAMLDIARTKPAVAVSQKQLDQDPELLNLVNGTFDLRSGIFRNHERADLLTKIAKVRFDPNANCPLWLEQLDLIFGSDTALIDYMQVLLGYCLSGLNGEEILPICYGAGANGKSTIWLVIHGILGDYAYTASQDVLLPIKNQHPTEIADLYGRRFVPVHEIEQGRFLRESMVKTLNEKVLKARRMREDFWEFERTHTFWLSTNHKPKIKGTDLGIWRRVKLIPFIHNIGQKLAALGKPVDPRFNQRLIETEGPGILNWLIQGYQKYKANGLEHFEPQSVKVATADYKDSQDLLKAFIDDCFVEAQGVETRLETAWQEFRYYTNGQTHVGSIKAFSDELRARGFEVVKASRSINRNKRVIRGFELAKGDDFEPAVEGG